MKLAFLWHMHQPPYRDPLSGTHRLPWALFHSLKNYRQMALLTGKTGFPSTVNFVPCLLEQIREYAAGEALDPFEQALAKEPDLLTAADCELLRRVVPRSRATAPEALQLEALRSCFSPLDEPEMKTRDELLELKRTALRELLPAYGRLRANGLIELTTSPYYHPLLPAVCDLQGTGADNLPEAEFRRPEDALEQLVRGRAFFETVFGFAPDGLWPPEGAVSAEAVSAVVKAGFRYGVTDENVLRKSFPAAGGPEALLRPYCSSGLTLFFRNRALADLISFTYNSWPPAQAAEHLAALVAGESKPAPEDAVMVIALDGENPWGWYASNAVPFLEELFPRLLETEGVEPATLPECLRAAAGPADEIVISPGTWMGNFEKWIGHPAKNRDWELLAEARRVCGPSDEMLAAEASDWFWWAGEPGEEEFDRLFRSFLEAACKKAGRKEPV
jgi:alpha-amylase/alpha-mannosidase (GH57 family)